MVGDGLQAVPFFLVRRLRSRRGVQSTATPARVFLSRFSSLFIDILRAQSKTCFMPDHLHLLVEGQSESSDLIRFAYLAKQRSAFTYRRLCKGCLWQKGYFEHVLRDDEITQVTAKYILENPVRGQLVDEPADCPFSGSLVYSQKQLLDLWCGGTP